MVVWAVLCIEDGRIGEEVEILFSTEELAREYQKRAIKEHPENYYAVEDWVVTESLD